MMKINLDNISYKYNDNIVLNNVNMTFEAGNYYVVIGNNGSGKSTLNKILSNIIKDYSGRITFDSLEQEDIFLLFQNPDYQFIKTTVLEEIVFGIENIGLTKDEIKTRLDFIVELFEIKDLIDMHTYQLSGGQKQKVLLAANLILQPKVIILDEALEMIDEHFKNKIMKYLNTIKFEEKTIIINVTHNMHDAALADYIYVLNDGNVTVEGNCSHVFSQTEEIKNANLTIPLAYYLSQYSNCNYEITKDLNKFKEYYDSIR